MAPAPATLDPFGQAADVLDRLAAGEHPASADVLAAALTLDSLTYEHGRADRDLLDAAAGLRELATGGRLDLDAAGRARASDLAALVRRLAS